MRKIALRIMDAHNEPEWLSFGMGEQSLGNTCPGFLQGGLQSNVWAKFIRQNADAKRAKFAA